MPRAPSIFEPTPAPEEDAAAIPADDLDEPTPEEYKAKVLEVTETAEYQDICKRFQSKMDELLGSDMTRQQLKDQCSEKKCSGIASDELLEKCNCARRIDVVMEAYHSLMHNPNLWRNVPFGDVMTYNDLYGNQQLFDDFLHVKMIHIDEDQRRRKQARNGDEKQDDVQSRSVGRVLHEAFSTKYPCKDFSKCKGSERHYRDRSDAKRENEMFHRIRSSGSKKAASIRNNQEQVFQEELDKVCSHVIIFGFMRL